MDQRRVTDAYANATYVKGFDNKICKWIKEVYFKIGKFKSMSFPDESVSFSATMSYQRLTAADILMIW